MIGSLLPNFVLWLKKKELIYPVKKNNNKKMIDKKNYINREVVNFLYQLFTHKKHNTIYFFIVLFFKSCARWISQ